MSAPLLEFITIEKAFFGVEVLRGISFEVHAGGAVGVVGENGAGKSTLMNILGGNLAPNAGEMRINGTLYQPKTPKDAEAHGIAFIHQELNLFPNLTIAENLFLTQLPTNAGLIARRALHESAAKILCEVGLELAPDQLVESLSTGERQLVEIAKALSIDARLIIFDEPTTSLTARETERLFALISRLRARGIAVIYISHTLADVFRLCDQIVTLRDGAIVANGPTASFTHHKLVSLMVGREINQLFPIRKPKAPGDPLLEVRNLTARRKFQKISFTIRRGEVIALAGLMGAGRSELARAIFGLDPRDSGEVLLENIPLRPNNPRESIRRGIAFLTENRGAEGLCLDASVADNFALASLQKYSTSGRLNFNSLKTAVTNIRNLVRLDPKTSDRQPARTLSGGNQQKVVLGKWLLNNPKLLILDEPTRGIDVGAKAEIYQLIHKHADDGGAALVISSEIEELIGICDRILVLRRGQLAGEFTRANFHREQILNAALGPAPATA
ncbi:MAG TPA: sugar ABC transporter ATP-binding protein [Verrucomicrobiae bacterium]|nr:sugar ABC transporter ATP-binding protein [Verrucomicrobiae bacterium]